MTGEPAITFRGALKILGHDDHPWLHRLDRLLGGVILASGLTPVSAVWGWVDQKNEATSLLRGVLDALSGRLGRARGRARHQLVGAAHTTLVLSAFFETLRDRMGRTYDQAKITKAEKVMLGTGSWQVPGEQLVRHLYSSDVPSPSAVRGFEENVEAVGKWAFRRMFVVGDFLEGIGFGDEWLDTPFVAAVAERYRSDYLRLATAVPEFKVWADLGEHAATRTALARLEVLLSQAVQESAPRDLRALVGALNRAELNRPVIDADIDGYGLDAVLPTVERIFLTPHFRCTTANRDARIGDPFPHVTGMGECRHMSRHAGPCRRRGAPTEHPSSPHLLSRSGYCWIYSNAEHAKAAAGRRTHAHGREAGARRFGSVGSFRA